MSSCRAESSVGTIPKRPAVPSASLAARPGRWWGALSLIAAPVLLLVGAVLRLGVNTLIGDEFYYVDFIHRVLAQQRWASWIWAQHNEHRVVPMKLLLAGLAGPTRWNQQAEMWCSVVLSAAIVWVLWRLYRRSGGTFETGGLLEFAPVAWLVCSLAQYENQLFGMMVCHYFTALGAVVSLWLLASGRVVALLLAVLAALVAASSIVNGFLIFPAGLAVLAARRSSFSRWATWCLSGSAALWLYSRSYLVPPHTQAFQWTLTGASRILELWLATLGAPLAAGSAGWAFALGVGFLAAAVCLVLRWLRADSAQRTNDAPAVGLILFGLASGAMVAAGRAFMNPPGALLGSRYITYTTLAWIGVYLVLLGETRKGRWPSWRIVAWSLLVPGTVAANLYGLAEARNWHRERLLDQYVLQTYNWQSDGVVGRLGPPESVRRAASSLSAERLSAFASPQRLLMLMDASTAKPSGEILLGQPIEQRLACPLETLHDVAVMVLPAARARGQFAVAVSSGGRELMRRSFDTASIRDWTWVTVPLAEPLRKCRGQELTVRVESLVSSPGGGVSTLLCAPYYDGALSQFGGPIPDRRLGLALDARALGVLH